MAGFVRCRHPAASDQRFVGRAVHRWRRESHLERASVNAGELGLGGAWLHPDPETNAGGSGRDRRHGARFAAPQIMPTTNPRITHNTSQATMGLKSTIPIGGMIRRIGSMIQSVKKATGRIHLR